MIRNILINSGSNVILFIIRTIITFIMTPIFVRNLGNYDYGIWEMVFVVVGYMGILDLGIRPSVSRFAAYYKAKDDDNALLSIYSTAFLYLFCLGLLSLLISISAGVFWPELLSESGNDTARYAWLLIIIGIQLLIMFPGQAAESCLEGYQKYYLKNNITLINLIIGTSITYTYINPENALVLVAGMNAAGTSIKFFIFYIILSKLKNNAVFFSPKAVSKERLKEIFTFSIKTFIQGVSHGINTSANKLIIGIIDGAEMLVFFVIPMRLFHMITGLISNISHIFMPLFSDQYGRGEHETLKRIFLIASKYIYSNILLLSIGMLCLGKEFIELWIGAEYAIKAHIIIICAAFVYIFSGINPIANRYLTAVNKHGLLAVTEPIRAAIRIPVAVILVYNFGYVGAAYSAFIPALLFVPYILVKTCSYLQVNINIYIKKVIIPNILPSIALFFFINYMETIIIIDGYFNLFLIAFLGAAVFYIVFFTVSVTKEEYSLLKQLLFKKDTFINEEI